MSEKSESESESERVVAEPSGHTGLSGASERSLSESELVKLVRRGGEVGEVESCVESMGLSGASERSSSESLRNVLDRPSVADDVAECCA